MSASRLLLLAPVLALVAACATQPAATPVNVAETIAHDPSLSTLSTLIAKAGLKDTLAAAGPYTVFAPTNDAFKAVPAKTMDELAADPARLKDVLSYHVLPAKVTAHEVKVGNAKTAQGATVLLGKAGDFVTVEEAMVQAADIAATNGVVHKVDRVLMPPRK
ncbi:fasciclin domain-containing protein [Ramlibacter albus]|uniref:Fasciclin domain-containing protein n=1 Tax=Ramlibacter albus TaxID=2079448 RepID=A0A923S3J5_9BURK|nr:fasciclin domain-containing protein [Ramlibacter albus]MBC5766624.1 fasciclin domain-containing protein [Ramlibacter albus]